MQTASDMIEKLPPITPVNTSMGRRRSVRRYVSGDLGVYELSHLLWAAYGVGDPRRTVPSAGSIYPLEIYLLSKGMLSRYLPLDHALEMQRAVGGLQESLYQASLRQKSILLAPVVIIVAANYDKIKRKYTGRGERYAMMEAGHVGQNIHLMCDALGLGCVMIGAFSDRKVKAVLGISEDPLYVIPVGRIREVENASL